MGQYGWGEVKEQELIKAVNIAVDNGINMFETQNNTGNQVLDVILTGKSLQCVENKINFTFLADGKLLNFMNVMDICSIFGNALDNAKENGLLSGHIRKPSIVELTQIVSLFCGAFRNRLDHMSSGMVSTFRLTPSLQPKTVRFPPLS
jgi:hypothetical protein